MPLEVSSGCRAYQTPMLIPTDMPIFSLVCICRFMMMGHGRAARTKSMKAEYAVASMRRPLVQLGTIIGHTGSENGNTKDKISIPTRPASPRIPDHPCWPALQPSEHHTHTSNSVHGDNDDTEHYFQPRSCNPNEGYGKGCLAPYCRNEEESSCL